MFPQLCSGPPNHDDNEPAGQLFTDEGVRIFEGPPDSKKILYGNLVWDGALALSKFLSNLASNKISSMDPLPGIQGKRVLELGSGTGVLGLACARTGASHVVVTDNEPELLTLLERNIEANALSTKVSAKPLDWEDKSTYLNECFDCVVAADVLYAGDGSSFCQALLSHLSSAPFSEAFVANHHHPHRCDATLGFIRMAIDSNMRVERLEDEMGCSVGHVPIGSPSQVFAKCRFVDLGSDTFIACQKVKQAKFKSGNANPFENIQIFRLTRRSGAASARL